MTTIFVMVKCDLQQVYEVAAQAADRVENVSEVHSISGEYDLLIKCFVPDDQDVGRFVSEKIQSLPGIRSTLTLIGFNAFSPAGPPIGPRR